MYGLVTEIFAAGPWKVKSLVARTVPSTVIVKVHLVATAESEAATKKSPLLPVSETNATVPLPAVEPTTHAPEVI